MTAGNYEPMTRDEVVNLLTLIANHDHRQPNPDTVQVWLMAAHEAKWRADEAARAVVKHIAFSTEYLKPGHITALIHEMRRSDRQELKALPGPDPATEMTRENAMAAAKVVFDRLATTREERWKFRQLFALPRGLRRVRSRSTAEDARRRAESATELERLRQERGAS